MLSSNEHSGLFTFVFGLVVVVFAGIALSIVVDRRFSFSASVRAHESEVKNNALELERLRKTHRKHSRRLAELEPQRKAAAAALATIQNRAADLERRRKSLEAKREGLKNSIPAMTEEFAAYRDKCREAIRYAAVGESLGTLTTPDGREYHQVFITHVTDSGMEIRHKHGSARFKTSELDASFWNRFQWIRGESQARLEEENTIPDANISKPNVTRSETAFPQPVKSDPDAAKIKSQRAKVIAWKARVSRLRSERYDALNASYGSRTSPPGSLETWQARAGRLGVELAKAEGELAAARAGLASISPNDSLLRANPNER